VRTLRSAVNQAFVVLSSEAVLASGSGLGSAARRAACRDQTVDTFAGVELAQDGCSRDHVPRTSKRSAREIAEAVRDRGSSAPTRTRTVCGSWVDRWRADSTGCLRCWRGVEEAGYRSGGACARDRSWGVAGSAERSGATAGIVLAAHLRRASVQSRFLSRTGSERWPRKTFARARAFVRRVDPSWWWWATSIRSDGRGGGAAAGGMVARRREQRPIAGAETRAAAVGGPARQEHPTGCAGGVAAAIDNAGCGSPT